MTARKHFKKVVRARMQKTGESYSSARRQVATQDSNGESGIAWHFPGRVPGTTALRVLLTHAGIRNPKTDKPFSEAMLFGIAGGIGIGLCSFYYQKADFASFFIAGRHRWHDEVGYLKNATARFGLESSVKESSSTKAGEKLLRTALETGPCVAWVDAAMLPYRAMPSQWCGGAYHLVTVYRIEDNNALIGDLREKPISIPLANLAAARARIKSQKNRLLSIAGGNGPVDLAAAVKQGLQACDGGLRGEGAMKQMKTNFTLEVLARWGERLEGSKDKESWKHVFGEGHRFLAGLRMLNDFAEHYGTGGGLCRPIFAEFLNEAADALKDSALRDLAKRYAALGQAWTKLADAALPDDVPLLREVKELQARKAKLNRAAGSVDEIRAIWTRLDEIDREAKAKFPLTPAECSQLRLKLQEQVRALHAGEVAAHAALGEYVA